MLLNCLLAPIHMLLLLVWHSVSQRSLVGHKWTRIGRVVYILTSNNRVSIVSCWERMRWISVTSWGMRHRRPIVSMTLHWNRLLLRDIALVDHHSSIWNWAPLHSMSLVIHLYLILPLSSSVICGLGVWASGNICWMGVVLRIRLSLHWMVLHCWIHVHWGVGVRLTTRRHRVSVRLVTLLIRLASRLIHWIHLLLMGRAWSTSTRHLIRLRHLLRLGHCWVWLTLVASFGTIQILTRVMRHLFLHICHLALRSSQWCWVWFASVYTAAIFLVRLLFDIMAIWGTTSWNLAIHLPLIVTILALAAWHPPRTGHIIRLRSAIALWHTRVTLLTFLSVHSDFFWVLEKNFVWWRTRHTSIWFLF